MAHNTIQTVKGPFMFYQIELVYLICLFDLYSIYLKEGFLSQPPDSVACRQEIMRWQ